jgi:hypothetical protein
VDEHYAYDVSTGLFKPGAAADPQFRTTAAGAISYFAGGDDRFPEDTGFALKPWTSVTWKNSGLLLETDRAWAMGTMIAINANTGESLVLQYILGYIKSLTGALRLSLHHASRSRGGRIGTQGLELPHVGISDFDIEKAQRAWSEGIVAIGSQYKVKGDYRKRAEQFVDTLYGYSIRPVFLKPAQAAQRPFRINRDSAISYFVGGDPRYPEDSGFALKPWGAVRFSNKEVAVESGQALAMGNMFLVGPGGIEEELEYTMGFVQDSNNLLHINLHHGSYPFSGLRRRRTVFRTLTLQEVQQAQKAWGDGIVQIGLEAFNRTRCMHRARNLVSQLYGYGMRTMLFRATDSSEGHFRFTEEGAVSYLVGGGANFPGDNGFALGLGSLGSNDRKPWKTVSFDNAGGINIMGDRAEAMGNYVFTDIADKQTKLEYSFGYFRDAEGSVRINLHFVSWPYSPANYNVLGPAVGMAKDLAGVVEKKARKASYNGMVVTTLGIVGAVCMVAACSAGGRALDRRKAINQNNFNNAYGYHSP